MSFKLISFLNISQKVMEDILSDLPHTGEMMKSIIDWMNSLDDEIRATGVRGKEQD